MSEEDDTHVDMAEGVVVQVDDKIECHIDINVSLTIEGESDVFRGRIGNTKKTFISAGIMELTKTKLNTIIQFGSKNTSVLQVYCKFDFPEPVHHVLMVEDVQALDYFFKLKRESFKSCNCRVLNPEWQRFISKDIKRIFGDIFRALLWLHNERYTCHEMKSHLFVTLDGRGKLMPYGAFEEELERQTRWDKGNVILLIQKIGKIIEPDSDPDAAKGLKKMREISQLPAVSEQLSQELNHVTSMKKLPNSVPTFWLMCPPLFWSTRKRISFPFQLREVMNRKKTFKKYLNSTAVKLGFFEEWYDSLGDGLYYNIWDKGYLRRTKEDSKEEDSKEDPNREGRYRSRADIVRYICAVYTHLNDSDYAGGKITEEEIEGNISKFFPAVYVQLFQAVGYMERYYLDPIERQTWLDELKKMLNEDLT